MNKMIAVGLVVAFAVTAGVAFAATQKCTVDTVEGDTVTMTCKKTELKAGDTVKVRADKKKVVEGC
jgi:hypothetical protein